MNAIEFANQVAQNKHQEMIKSQQRWITELEDKVKIAQDNLVAANVRLEEMQKRTPDTIKLTPKMIEIVEMMLAGKVLHSYNGLHKTSYQIQEEGAAWDHITVRADFVEALISYGIIRQTGNSHNRKYTLSVSISE